MENRNKGTTCSKIAYNYILDALQRGAFAPGQDISDTAIAEKLEISRMPVREAIIWLCNEGFLETFPRKGTFVSKYSFQDIMDVYDVRIRLEPPIIAAGCGGLTLEQLQVLQGFRAYNQKYVDDDSPVVQSGEFFVQDINLHLFLFSLPQSPFFEQISTMALTRCIIAKAGIYNRLRTKHRDIAVSHIQLIDAIVDGNSALVEQSMLAHLVSIRDALVRHYTL